MTGGGRRGGGGRSRGRGSGRAGGNGNGQHAPGQQNPVEFYLFASEQFDMTGARSQRLGNSSLHLPDVVCCWAAGMSAHAACACSICSRPYSTSCKRKPEPQLDAQHSSLLDTLSLVASGTSTIAMVAPAAPTVAGPDEAVADCADHLLALFLQAALQSSSPPVWLMRVLGWPW
jgi:hypothetical protein